MHDCLPSWLRSQVSCTTLEKISLLLIEPESIWANPCLNSGHDSVWQANTHEGCRSHITVCCRHIGAPADHRLDQWNKLVCSPQVTFKDIPGGRLPLLSARPVVTFPGFPVKERHCPLTSTSYTVWWQKNIGVNNLPKVVMQLCPSGNWTHDLLIASRCLTATPPRHPTSIFQLFSLCKLTSTQNMLPWVSRYFGPHQRSLTVGHCKLFWIIHIHLCKYTAHSSYDLMQFIG